MKKKSSEELAEKHMSTISVASGLEEPTKKLVKKMIEHPAFNNPE